MILIPDIIITVCYIFTGSAGMNIVNIQNSRRRRRTYGKKSKEKYNKYVLSVSL